MALEVFLSYSRTDGAAFTAELADALARHGIATWIDRNIGSGRRWTAEIERALRRSTHVLVVLSPGAAASPNVDDEINFALDEGKQIIPVLFQPCSIPLRLRSLQYVDFVNQPFDQALRVLLDVFRRTTTLPTQPPPATANPIAGQRQPGHVGAPAAAPDRPTRRLHIGCVSLLLLAGALAVGLALWIGPVAADLLARFGLGSPTVVASVDGRWAEQSGGLEIAVTKVERLRDGRLRVWIAAHNTTGDSLRLPLFGYFVATDDTGTGYQANTQASDWAETLPHGTTLSGVVVLDRPVAENSSSITISFTQIFGSLSGPHSITVGNIPLPRTPQ